MMEGSDECGVMSDEKKESTIFAKKFRLLIPYVMESGSGLNATN
jgi:hypothetical protein